MNSQEPRDFVSDVLDVVTAIPPGCAMSYGAVAATVGSRAARQVGGIMARYGGGIHEGMLIPWWRVVRADGHPPSSHRIEAHAHYLVEGTPLIPANAGPGDAYRVDMRRAEPSRLSL